VSSLISRRTFLGASAASGACLLLGARLPARAAPSGQGQDQLAIANLAEADGPFAPNLWIRIDEAGTLTVSVHRSEMGQHVDIALPMIIADELEVDWQQVVIEHAGLDEGFGSQLTGGSASISSSWLLLRALAAHARTMLVTAAAGMWDVDPAECRAEHGEVIHVSTGQRLAYGELVEAASALPTPKAGEFALKDPFDFRIIGGHVPDPDGPGYVSGQARFTCDLVVPGMLIAAVARPPTIHGSVAGFDAGPALAVDGVRAVVAVDSGVAVVADSTWAALQGRQVLPVTWDEGDVAGLDSAAIRETALGGVGMLDDPAVIEAVYEVPYLAHAPMEPMDCLADVRDDHVEIWAPTQDRRDAARVAAMAADLPADAVTVHVPLIGGGFGRRLVNDFVAEACQISKAVKAPVKTFWTREDDIRHDPYHPFTLVHASAPRDLSARPRTIATAGWGPPTGAWRSVDEVNLGLASGCILDELAVAIGVDVVEVYRRLYAEDLLPVVERATEQAGWGSPLPDGWGRGLAAHATFGQTPVGIVLEVSVVDGRLHVHRAVCAIDCGIAVDPDGVVAQMEGGIAFALSAALHEEITLSKGRVEQTGFLDFPILRFDEMPRVEVHILPSSRDPSGVGEMGVPPTAPALLNAVFAATGRRLRRLPIRADDLASV
jgi:isoquinoline 1-oxidoreductase beta subunit